VLLEPGNSAGKPSRSVKQCGASFPRATTTGGAWVHAPSQKIQAAGRSVTTSFPLLFLVGSDNHRYLQKEETQKAVNFNFLSPFQICSRVFPFFQICFISAFSLCLRLFSFGFPYSVLGSYRRLCFCHVWPAEMEEKKVLADRWFRLEMALDLWAPPCGGCCWRV